MIKALLFALLFAFVGRVVFSSGAPLFVQGENARKAGAVAFPFILLIGGGAGFVVGWRPR